MHTHLVLTDEFDPIDHFFKSIIKSINWVYNVILKFFGMLGLFLTTPIFLLATIILWVLVKRAVWTIEAQMKKVFVLAQKASPREVMLLHHKIKQRRINTELVLRKTKNVSEFLPVKPIFGNIKYAGKLFLEAEERLHKTAYPHLYQPLTEDQKEQLRSLNKSWEGIWQDDDVCTMQ